MTHTSADDWAATSVAPGPGGGTLARFGPVIVLIGSDDPDVVRPYLEHAAMVAANGGQGRQLIRGFALMLSTAVDASPGFAAIAPHTTGLAVFVDGDVTVLVDDQQISGADSLAWVERLIPWPVASVTATLAGGMAPADSSPYRIDGGVIPAGSFRLPAADGTTSPPVAAAMDVRPPTQVRTPEPAAEPEPAPAAQATPAAPAAPAAPVAPVAGRPLPPAPADEQVSFQSVMLSDVDDDMDDFEPLPIVESPEQVHDHAHHEEVRGVYCKNQHFNDPRVLFCGICGINMVQQTPILVNGPRPPLGVIVLDDGAVFQLDTPYLLGRDPAPDERIVAGRFRPLPIIDQSNEVSRVHARLELRGWDVVLVDNNSTNGTYVHLPKTPDWVRMPPGTEQVLTQGTRVRIGHRTLAFNTHAGSSGG